MKMKKFTLIIGAFLLTASLPLLSQKNLTNKLIWEGPEFSGDFFAGLNSMNDGLHYSLSEESDAFGTQIVKYSYSTGEKVGVISTAKDIFGNTDKSIEDYAFSTDESKRLFKLSLIKHFHNNFSRNLVLIWIQLGLTLISLIFFFNCLPLRHIYTF